MEQEFGADDGIYIKLFFLFKLTFIKKVARLLVKYFEFNISTRLKAGVIYDFLATQNEGPNWGNLGISRQFFGRLLFSAMKKLNWCVQSRVKDEQGYFVCVKG